MYIFRINLRFRNLDINQQNFNKATNNPEEHGKMYARTLEKTENETNELGSRLKLLMTFKELRN